jgi:hypothetical protein
MRWIGYGREPEVRGGEAGIGDAAVAAQMTPEEAAEEILVGALEDCSRCKGMGLIRGNAENWKDSSLCSQCRGHGQQHRPRFVEAAQLLDVGIPVLLDNVMERAEQIMRDLGNRTTAAKMILEHRNLSKLRSTYVQGIYNLAQRELEPYQFILDDPLKEDK